MRQPKKYDRLGKWLFGQLGRVNRCDRRIHEPLERCAKCLQFRGRLLVYVRWSLPASMDTHAPICSTSGFRGSPRSPGWGATRHLDVSEDAWSNPAADELSNEVPGHDLVGHAGLEVPTRHDEAQTARG